MYAAISTENQTGQVLGTIQELCPILSSAWTQAQRFNSKKGMGVVRRVKTGQVEVGETVGFFDDRLEIVEKPKHI